MKSKLINNGSEKTFAVILQHGDEVMSLLKQFAHENRLKASHFSAIGAFENATIAFFNWEKKTYVDIVVDEQVEVLSMIGDITLEKETPRLHAHVVLGKADGTAHGGHLVKATVRPTLEIIVVESQEYLRRQFDQESGLPLIDAYS